LYETDSYEFWILFCVACDPSVDGEETVETC